MKIIWTTFSCCAYNNFQIGDKFSFKQIITFTEKLLFHQICILGRITIFNMHHHALSFWKHLWLPLIDPTNTLMHWIKPYNLLTARPCNMLRNSHWDLHKMAAMLQMTIWSTWMKKIEFSIKSLNDIVSSLWNSKIFNSIPLWAGYGVSWWVHSSINIL